MAESPAPLPSNLEHATDSFLVDRAAEGDARAFGVLVHRYARILVGYANRVLGGAGNGDDVVQEALISAWQQLGTLEDRTAVRGWLIRITGRKAIDFLRRLITHDDVEDHPEIAEPRAAGPEGTAHADALSAALDDALSALPEAQRRAWTMRELGGHSYEEIAADLDLPLSTVRGLLARARRTLVGQMQEWR